MNIDTFRDRLEKLRVKTKIYFNTSFDTPEAEDMENFKIKSGAIQLIRDAKDNGNELLYKDVKDAVINYLCEFCGHSGDLEILRKYSPSILSEKDVEYVIQNSALSRWF